MAVGAVPARISLASASLAAGLEFEPGTDSQRARLALDLAASNDFSSGFGELTGVGSATVTGGKLEINGAGSFDANGVYLTTPVSKSTPGKFKIKMVPRDDALGMMIGFAAGAALDFNADFTPRIWFDNVAGIEIFARTAFVYHATQALAVGTEYTVEAEWGPGTSLALYITGGAFASRTKVAEYVKSDLAATLGFEINAFTNHADAWEFDDFERYSGYKTNDPVATLADIDSGVNDSAWDMSKIDFAGSETNLTYSYAYGNSASPSNWSAYLSLASLQAESDPTGRYFKLRVKASSDGATQVEITEGTIEVGLAESPAADIALTTDDTIYQADATVTVGGGITCDKTVAGATVTLTRNKESDDSLLATLYTGTVSFVATVQKTWAAMAGAAVTFAPATAGQQEYVKAVVSGGTPTLASDTDKYGYYVAPSLNTPGLAVVDDGDGSVTATGTGNAGQTSRLKYKTADDAAWTVHGTSLTGNGTISDLTGLTYGLNYWFLLVPYDSVTGLEGPPSAPVLLYIEEAAAAVRGQSTHDVAVAAAFERTLARLGEDVIHTPWGGLADTVTAIVSIDRRVFDERDNKTLIEMEGLADFSVEEVATTDRRDKITIGDTVFGVMEWDPAAAGMLRAHIRWRRHVRVAARATIEG